MKPKTEHKPNVDPLVQDLAGWIGSFMWFPDPGYAIVAALWAIHTWIYEEWDMTPYLEITANGPGCGKTRLLNILSLLVRKGIRTTAATPAAIFTAIEQFDGRLTLMIDEAEAFSSGSASVMRAVINTGAYRGAEVMRQVTQAGTKSVTMSRTYCPKCVAMIGTPWASLRDRTIELYLRHYPKEAQANVQPFSFALADAPARALVARIGKALEPFKGQQLPEPDLSVLPDRGRERDIWRPIFTLALMLDPTVLPDVIATANDIAEAKKGDQRSYRALEQATNKDDSDRSYAERALYDLHATLDAKDKHVTTAQAVDRLRGIPASPWRTYRGTGLDQIKLAQLLVLFLGKAANIKIGPGKVARGWTRTTIEAAVKGARPDGGL